MASLIEPLSEKMPIVDPNTGKPNPYFIRLLQRISAGEGLTVNPNGSIDIGEGLITLEMLEDIANHVVLGRNTAGAGGVEEVTFSQFLDWVGSAAQGDILYRNGTVWTRLAAGTAGQVLTTGGAGANPSWAASAASTFSGALIFKSADETSANYSNVSAVPFNSESYDTDGYHPVASTVTMTIASPGVVTWTGHNFLLDSPIVFTTTGALPTGITAGNTYYVLNPAANTFQVSSTRGGAAVNTTGSQSGTHTATNYSRFTITTAGKYRFAGRIDITAATLTASDYARIFISKNGSTVWIGGGGSITEISATPGVVLNIQSAVVDCVSGDYFELILDTETDSSLTVTASTSWFSIQRIT